MRFLLFLTLTIAYTLSFAQEEFDFVGNKKSFSIQPTSERIIIDGELSEETWSITPKQGDFYQQSPLDGIPADKVTEVQVTYDNDFLYIAATLYDEGDYVINTLKRDQFGSGDQFAVVIDPQNQKSNGFAFGVNVAGAPSEALMAANNVDEGWDNKWKVATSNYVDRWTVEMAIPFKTLRFKAENNTWGINFYRDEPSLNQQHVWSPVPRQFDGIDIGYFGEMVYETPPKKQGKNIAVIPYVSARTDKNASGEAAINSKITAGADAKIALTSSLNLDLTVNPDFSQVDVDRQVTNLTRFNIFFPERRQFFLENADIFNGYGQFANSPFYSRRIGLDQQGNTVPILYGGRLTGNINKKLRIGAFSMQTAKNEITSSQNYSAFSGQHALGARSNIKGFFLSRQAYDGTESINGDYGRNAGGELNLSTKDGVWQGQLGYVHSFKDGFNDKNKHIYGRINYSGQNFRTFLFIQNLGENYYADMGFNARLINFNPITGTIERIGYTQIGNMLDYYYYPENSTVNFHWSGLENFIIINDQTGLNEWYTRLRHFIFFKNTSQIRFRLNNNYVDLIFPFALTETPLPVDAYNMTEFNIQYLSDQRKLFNFEIFSVYGQFYNGTKFTNILDFNYRIQPWARFSLGLEQNNIRLPQPYGNLDLTLVRMSAEINFSTSLFWTTFVQYNTQSSNFNINSRVQWRYSPMSDLFVVYSDDYIVEGILGPKSRSIVLKVNYWLGL
ncbi:carbohydrate binding family 9 domain-containing protein [Portibacter marinus]|uniref:carbohydrate binding family 9 domain-containing protein n=1 Tax=Portibacter marinus TaxID=2898660 RepID=UPI001F1A453B|nr:DUF5916 domain-containing protein [Portibacter marinus]